MSDRSEELLRQREFLRQHLAWLDNEIAREESAAAAGEPAARPEPPPIVRRAFSVSASDADRDAEAILAQYRMPAPSVANEAKRGCILYFALAMALFIALSGAFIFFFEKSRR